MSGTLTLDATSRIDVSSKGYLASRTLGNTTTGASSSRVGGSYGGLGGLGNSGGSANAVYGDLRAPNELGSGGNGGGKGGGLTRITATEVVLDGAIRADGGNGGTTTGAGSGGGIRMDVGTLRGVGVISASGGSTGQYGGGGGGGRIAIYYTDMTGFDRTQITAYGGTGFGKGGAGTIFLKAATQNFGELIVDNNNLVSSIFSTPLRAISPGMSTNLSSTVLTNTIASFPVPDLNTGALGLKGLQLDPNILQGITFTVTDNTATTITIDGSEGDMTTVAVAGDPYIGVYFFDSIEVINGSSVSTGDDIIATNVFIDGTSRLLSNNLDLP